MAACSPAPTPVAITLTDGLNRAVTLHGPAQRIVSLAPSNTELLYEVGAVAQVVGRDDFSDFPAEAKALTSVGGSMGSYNLAAIAALKPDLVLAAQINTPEQVKSLEDLGLTVFYLNNPKHLVDLYQNLQTVGTLTGKTGQAAALIQSLQRRIQALIDKLPTITDHYKVYYEARCNRPHPAFYRRAWLVYRSHTGNGRRPKHRRNPQSHHTPRSLRKKSSNRTRTLSCWATQPMGLRSTA